MQKDVKILKDYLRKQIKPLLFCDRLLTKKFQNDRAHEIPFVFKLKRTFVLKGKKNIVNKTVSYLKLSLRIAVSMVNVKMSSSQRCPSQAGI